jgi:hypothetical protein
MGNVVSSSGRTFADVKPTWDKPVLLCECCGQPAHVVIGTTGYCWLCLERPEVQFPRVDPEEKAEFIVYLLNVSGGREAFYFPSEEVPYCIGAPIVVSAVAEEVAS